MKAAFIIIAIAALLAAVVLANRSVSADCRAHCAPADGVVIKGYSGLPECLCQGAR